MVIYFKLKNTRKPLVAGMAGTNAQVGGITVINLVFIVISVTTLSFSRHLARPLSVIRVQKVCGGKQTASQMVIQTFTRAVSALFVAPMTPGIPAHALNARGAATRRLLAQPGLQPIMRDTNPATSGGLQPLFT